MPVNPEVTFVAVPPRTPDYAARQVCVVVMYNII